MKLVEDFEIKPNISEELFDELKTQIKTRTITADNQKLLEFIQPACAYLTISKGLAEKAVTVNEYGVVHVGLQATQFAALTLPAAAIERLDAIIRRADQNGKSYLKQLQKYLNENSSESKYPLYYASDLYTSDGSDQIDNKDTYGIIGV